MGSAVFVLLAVAVCRYVRILCISRFDTLVKRLIFYIPCCFLVFFVFFFLAYLAMPSVQEELNMEKIQKVIFFLAIGILLSAFDLSKNSNSSSGAS